MSRTPEFINQYMTSIIIHPIALIRDDLKNRKYEDALNGLLYYIPQLPDTVYPEFKEAEQQIEDYMEKLTHIEGIDHMQKRFARAEHLATHGQKIARNTFRHLWRELNQSKIFEFTKYGFFDPSGGRKSGRERK